MKFQPFIISLILFSLFSVSLAVNHGESLILQNTRNHKYSDLQPEDINIHLFPHSHTDVGWLKKIDEYLYGYRSYNEWMVGNATQTLNSVIDALLQDPKYKFVWAEQAFFSRWWLRQNKNVRQAVLHLIENKQFSLVGGGWVVNDEACTYYEDIIDQQSVGHQFLHTFLDFQPTMGWQQDPFGHSQTQAWIMSQMGLEGAMMSRIDYQEELKLLDEKKMQFMWQLPHNRQLFTMVLFYRYVAPEGYEYDYRFTKSEYNQFARSGTFSKPSMGKSKELGYWFRNVSCHYNTDEFAYSMGNDFTYLDAKFSYTAYDAYIKNIEKSYDQLHAKVDYIRADDFMKILNKKKQDFEPHNKNDDFFPYRDDKGAYWSGYYTTLPYLKKMVMDNGRLLQKLRNYLNLEFLNQDIPEFYNSFQLNKDSKTSSIQESFSILQNTLLRFEQEMAAMQHHDAVTGTCKNDVAEDYKVRVVNSRNNIAALFEQIITQKGRQELKNLIQNSEYLEFKYCVNDIFKSQKCTLKDYKKNTILNIQNYHTKKHSQVIEIQGYESLKNYKMVDLNQSKVIKGELLCFKSECILYFETELLPYQNNYIYLYEDKQNPSIENISASDDKSITLQKQKLEFQYDKSHQFQFTSKDSNKYTFDLSYKKYNNGGGGGGWGANANGAYIFSTSDKEAGKYVNLQNNKFSSYNGNLVSCMEFQGNTSLYICLKKDKHFLHIQTHLESQRQISDVVLDINIQDLKNDKQFQTDSNGLFRMQRHKDKQKFKKYYMEDDTQDEISGNFYPVTKFLTIKDSNKRATLMNDRSQGGSSLKDGNIQIMLNRQSNRDDGRGLGQALKDNHDYILNHYLMFDFSENEERLVQLNLDLQEEIFLSDKSLKDDKFRDIKVEQKYMKTIQEFLELLPYQAKFTWKYLKNNEFLLRIQNFKDDGNINVKIEDSIPQISQILQETNIQGTRTLTQIAQQNVQFYNTQDKEMGSSSKNHHISDRKPLQIQPLDIRSFRAYVTNKDFLMSHGEDITEKVWERPDDSKWQTFCRNPCYEKGICVWNKCTCLNSYDNDCKKSCQDGCLKCTSTNNCSLCMKGYELQNNSCVPTSSQQQQQNQTQTQQSNTTQQEPKPDPIPTCGNDQFYDSDSKKCQQCHNKCQQCSESKYNCTKCGNGQVLVDGQCFHNCNSSKNIDNCQYCNENQECQKCSNDFKLIYRNNEYQCEEDSIQGQQRKYEEEIKNIKETQETQQRNYEQDLKHIKATYDGIQQDLQDQNHALQKQLQEQLRTIGGQGQNQPNNGNGQKSSGSGATTIFWWIGAQVLIFIVYFFVSRRIRKHRQSLSSQQDSSDPYKSTLEQEL